MSEEHSKKRRRTTQEEKDEERLLWSEETVYFSKEAVLQKLIAELSKLRQQTSQKEREIEDFLATNDAPSFRSIYQAARTRFNDTDKKLRELRTKRERPFLKKSTKKKVKDSNQASSSQPGSENQ